MGDIRTTIRNVSKDGEITINLNLSLTVKIDTDGTAKVVSAEQRPAPPMQAMDLVTQENFVIPDLGDDEIIDFGKPVEDR